MSPFALDIIVRASALLVAAALADLVLRRRSSAAIRHFVWTLAIGALLLLPIASYALPEWTVPIPITKPFAPPIARSGTAASSAVGRTIETVRAVTGSWVDDGKRCDQEREPVGGLRLTPGAAIAAIFVVYAAGDVLLLVRFFLEPFALRRLTRASRDVTDAAWRRVLDDAAAQLRVARTVRLVLSERDV